MYGAFHRELLVNSLIITNASMGPLRICERGFGDVCDFWSGSADGDSDFGSGAVFVAGAGSGVRCSAD
jgi:hypothetical protein